MRLSKYPHTGKYGACRFEIIEKSDAGDYNRPTMKFDILGQLPREGKRWQIGIKTARELEKQGKVEIIDGIVKKAVYPEDEIDKRKLNPFWSHFAYKDVGTALNGNELLNTILGYAVDFDTVKPSKLIEEFISHLPKDCIILDSFAGSGTTAHAVLNMNKVDGGNRRFILVEMMDYAESITAERVRRVIDGYGDTSGTGGGFDYYELGEPLMFANGNINEGVETSKIRDYVWYMETKQPAQTVDLSDNPYLLGVTGGTAYYFNYEKDAVPTLDTAFLETLNTKAERYVIYADQCTLPDETLSQFNITFKKIPRDIAKL